MVSFPTVHYSILCLHHFLYVRILHQQTKIKVYQDSLTQHKFTEDLFPVMTVPYLTVCLTRVSTGRKCVQNQTFSTHSTSNKTIILTGSVYKFPISFSLEKCVKMASSKYKMNHFSKDFCISPFESKSHDTLSKKPQAYWYLSASFYDLQNLLRIISCKYPLLTTGHTQYSTIMSPSTADFQYYHIKFIQIFILILCMLQTKKIKQMCFV